MSGNILTTIETDISGVIHTVETDVGAVIGTAETLVKVVWADVTGTIEADAKVFMSDVSTLWSKLLPAEYALFKSFASQVLGDLFTGDFAAAETAVLNLASEAGQTFVSEMGSPLIQALLAMLKGVGL